MDITSIEQLRSTIHTTSKYYANHMHNIERQYNLINKYFYYSRLAINLGIDNTFLVNTIFNWSGVNRDAFGTVSRRSKLLKKTKYPIGCDLCNNIAILEWENLGRFKFDIYAKDPIADNATKVTITPFAGGSRSPNTEPGFHPHKIDSHIDYKPQFVLSFINVNGVIRENCKFIQCGSCAGFVSGNLIAAGKCNYCRQVQAGLCLLCDEPRNDSMGAYPFDLMHQGCISEEKIVNKCKLCSKPITKNEVICKKCEPHVINDYNYKPIAQFRLANPGEKHVFMGIELEAEIKPALRNFMLKKDVGFRFKTEVNEKMGDFVYLKRDSSIGVNGYNDRGDCAFEIVTHPATIEYWTSDAVDPFFDGLVKLAKSMSSYNTGNCGTHVHISRNGFESLRHSVAFGWFIENRLYFTSVISERSSIEYAKIGLNPWARITKEYLSKDHHSLINYTPHTIEVRPFRGNMKPERILKNLLFVYSVWDWTRQFQKTQINQFKDYLTINSYLEFINADPDKYKILIEYINEHLNPLFVIEAKGPSVFPVESKQKLFFYWTVLRYDVWPDRFFKLNKIRQMAYHKIFSSVIESDNTVETYLIDTLPDTAKEEITSLLLNINPSWYENVKYLPSEELQAEINDILSRTPENILEQDTDEEEGIFDNPNTPLAQVINTLNDDPGFIQWEQGDPPINTPQQYVQQVYQGLFVYDTNTTAPIADVLEPLNLEA